MGRKEGKYWFPVPVQERTYMYVHICISSVIGSELIVPYGSKNWALISMGNEVCQI